MEPLAKLILGVAFAVVAIIYWLDWRKHRKLDDIHDEMKSMHNRHDQTDQRIEHTHAKLDRVRHGIALLFKGNAEEFVKWWRDK